MNAQKLRSIIARALPGAEECVKWLNPTYRVGGRNVAWLQLYKDHVNLGFFKGSSLKSKRLVGTGKGLRHVKVWKPSDIDEAEFSRLLRDAEKIS